MVLARDPESETFYVTHVFKREQVEPAVQAEALRAIGKSWLPGAADASALVRDSERTRYIDVYKQLGLNVTLAEKAVESGIQAVYDLMSMGRFKVFASCKPWFDEWRQYQRDEKGRIIKRNDHLMDSTRYGIMQARRMRVSPANERLAKRQTHLRRQPFETRRRETSGPGSLAWMN